MESAGVDGRSIGLAGVAAAALLLVGCEKLPERELTVYEMARLELTPERTRRAERLCAELVDPVYSYQDRAGFIMDVRACGPAATPALCRLLKHQDAGIRNLAVSVLAEVGDARAVPDLVALVNDKKQDARTIREWAVSGLGRIGDPRASDALVAALKDKAPGIRSGAAAGLGRAGKPTAVPALIRTLEDPVLDVRKYATYSLGSLRDQRAVDPLIKTLQHRDARMRSWAVRSLSMIGGARTIGPVNAVAANAKEDEEVRLDAIVALGRIGGRQVRELLKALLNNPSPRIHLQTTETLKWMDARAQAERLKAAAVQAPSREIHTTPAR